MGLAISSRIWLNERMENSIGALRLRVAKHKGHLPLLAKESELSIWTLRKIVQGQVEDPRKSTVDKIESGLAKLAHLE